MYPDPSTLPDEQLAILAMAADLLVNYTDEYTDEQHALFAELDRRYPGGTDRTADHVTGTRMTSWEALTWAVTNWPGVRSHLRGPQPGDHVTIDGITRAVVRSEPRGQATPAGHVWLRIDDPGAENDRHSMLAPLARIESDTEGV